MSKETEKTEVPEAADAPETAKASATPEEAELQGAGETPEHEEHHPAKQSSGSSGAFLAMVIALVAVGVSVYLWMQQQSLREETQSLQQGIDRLHGLVEERHSSQQQQIETLAGHRHAKTEEQLGKLGSLLQDLRVRVGEQRGQWAVAEVEFLLRIAQDSLTFEYDRKTTLAALGEARDRLAMLKQDKFQPVIHQIDTDIGKLSALSLPNRTQIAASLAALASSVDNWPLAEAKYTGKTATPEETEAKEQVDEGGWRQVLAKIWRDIRSLVSIRHDGEVSRPLLEPQQRYFLQQNLLLKLEAARLALLSGNSRAYRDSLTEASAWLQRYYDTSSVPVIEAQKQLEQLASINLQPELPTLGQSIELLHKAAKQLRPKTETAPKATSPSKKAPKPAPASNTKPTTKQQPPAKAAPVDPGTAAESGAPKTSAQPATAPEGEAQ